MKRLLIFMTLLAMMIPFGMRGEIVKECDLHYDMSDFIIEEKDSMVDVTVVPNLDLIPYMDYDMPYLPKFGKTVMKGKSSGCYDVEFNVEHAEKIIVKEDVDIATLYPLDENGYLMRNKRIKFDRFDKNDSTVWPLAYINFYYSTIVLWTSPFQYDEETRTLYFIPDIHATLRIHPKETTESDLNIIIYPREVNVMEGNKEKVSQEEESMDDISLYMVIPWGDRGIEVDAENFSTPLGFDYLLITTNDMKDAYQPLIDWKRQKGLKVKVLTTEEIGADYEGKTLYEKIKACISKYYYNEGTVYVLLGGSSKKVPSPPCYGKLNMGDGETLVDRSIPADLYYACIKDKVGWDSNGNGILGESEDECELTSHVGVTRIPLDTQDEVSAFITKLLKYEKTGHVASDFDILLTGAEMYWNKGGQSDAEINGNYVAQIGITPYWTGSIQRKFDTSGDGYNVNSRFIADEFSKGHAFIDVQTHGEPANWILSNGSRFGKKTNSTSIKNVGSTIVTTNACEVNAFDKSSSSNPCLSQYLIGDADSGVVAFYGNSRKGIGLPESGKTGISQLFEGSFYGMLFKNPEENKSLGKIVGLSKRIFMENASTANVFRWLQFGMNAIGDPEMPIYVTQPKVFDTIKVRRKGDMYRFEPGIEGCTISVTGTRNGKEFRQAIKKSSFMNLSNLPDDAVLVITKQNYIPFIVEGADNIRAISVGFGE